MLYIDNNNITLTRGDTLTLNDKIRVYGRESRGSSYYMYAGTLTIIEA